MTRNLDEECLDIYENDFEAPFFVATEMYYKGEAETFLAAARESNFSYFKKVQDRLNEEKNRIEQYGLVPKTRASLIPMLEEIFWAPYFHAIYMSFQDTRIY